MLPMYGAARYYSGLLTGASHTERRSIFFYFLFSPCAQLGAYGAILLLFAWEHVCQTGRADGVVSADIWCTCGCGSAGHLSIPS